MDSGTSHTDASSKNLKGEVMSTDVVTNTIGTSLPVGATTIDKIKAWEADKE